jgi:hypothetical protein
VSLFGKKKGGVSSSTASCEAGGTYGRPFGRINQYDPSSSSAPSFNSYHYLTLPHFQSMSTLHNNLYETECLMLTVAHLVGSCRVNCCWPSPAQSFLVPFPAGLMTTFFCLMAIGFVRHFAQLVKKNSPPFIEIEDP